MKGEVWTEKYRPTKFDDLVYDDKGKLKRLLEKNDTFPHLLLHSKSGGTGKGSIFNVIATETGAVTEVINASQDTSIENIRKIVNEFVSAKSWLPTRKILFLDEVDGLSKQAMDSLKNTMEKYVKNVIFILATNRFEKIPNPIKSRCTKIDLKAPNRNKIFERLKYICEQENVDIEDKSIKRLIKLNYPDMRVMVKQLDDLSFNGQYKIEFDMITKEVDNFEVIWEHIINGRITEAKKVYIINNLDIDYLFRYIYDMYEKKYPNHKNNPAISKLFYDVDVNIKLGGNPDVSINYLIVWLHKYLTE